MKLATDSSLKTWSLTKRQLCDVECLLNGAYAPLPGFLNQDDYESVCTTMRLTNGSLWPMPITLDVSQHFADQLQLGEAILLIDDENTPLATLTIDSIWHPNKEKEAQRIFGTTDKKHPGVHYLYEKAGSIYLGGKLKTINLPSHYDFIQYRHTPEQLKETFKLYGWSRIVAFQTRNPMHRAHYELTQRAIKALDAHLLIHPVVGMTKPGDIEYITRVRCYEQILKQYENLSALLSLLPLAMRMAGPKEALWHAIIRKNYGVTHFIIGRDHAGPGLNSEGRPFYDPYAAQQLANDYAEEIGIEMLSSSSIVYAKEKNAFLTQEEVMPDDTIEDISGTELRNRLQKGLPIPDWFSFKEVINILQQQYPLRQEQGYTLFFTGLSGAGKSTLAKAVQARLSEAGQQVTLLDGDIARKHLSNELGFSKKDRDTHIKRLAFVAAEITRHRGVAICAAIAPYEETRQAVRDLIIPHGGFIEIYVSTPIEVCKKRDVKHLYKKAELGHILEFTGVDHPYEPPQNPELVIDTSKVSVTDAVEIIFTKIAELGFKQRTHSFA
jgi:sulfate adenylyltransferase